MSEQNSNIAGPGRAHCEHSRQTTGEDATMCDMSSIYDAQGAAFVSPGAGYHPSLPTPYMGHDALPAPVTPQGNYDPRLPTPPSNSDTAFNPLLEWHEEELARDRLPPSTSQHSHHFNPAAAPAPGHRVFPQAASTHDAPQYAPVYSVPYRSSHAGQFGTPYEPLRSVYSYPTPQVGDYNAQPAPALSYFPAVRPQWDPGEYYTPQRYAPHYAPPVLYQPPAQMPYAAPLRTPALPSGRMPILSQTTEALQAQCEHPQHTSFSVPGQHVSQHMPPIQNWTVTPQHPLQDQALQEARAAAITAKYAGRGRATTATAPAPTPEPNVPLDKETRRKQEKYRQKGEAKRRSISENSSKKSRTPKRRKTAQPQEQSHTIAPTQAANYKSFEQLLAESKMPKLQLGASQAYMSPYGLPQSQPPASSDHEMVDVAPKRWPPLTNIQAASAQRVPPFRPNPPKPRDNDDLAQAITTEYNEYKWSVKLYEISMSKSGYQFAQAWLEDQFAKLDFTYRWLAHTTVGFIKDGNRVRFLVLHNAANPPELGVPDAESSTSIGVYGCYWYESNEIHWKTFVPGIRSQLQNAEAAGLIRQVQKWQVDMKPKEKRWHRAYWLSANRLRLGGILNGSRPYYDRHDEAEDEENFQIAEEDLINDCGEVSADDALQARKYVREEGKKERPKVVDHLDTGYSEL